MKIYPWVKFWGLGKFGEIKLGGRKKSNDRMDEIEGCGLIGGSGRVHTHRGDRGKTSNGRV